MRPRRAAGFDTATLSEAFAGPGQDSRQWVSFGVVDEDDGDNHAVTFDEKIGPLVNVTLHPSGMGVRCRVAGDVAGNGEGEWMPFIPRDEVLVVIPEGDERAGCTIIGRLNNGIDAWPKQVAGQDATKNTFGFRRLRVPYILETAASYLIRSAVTGAFISIGADGRITVSSADNSFLSLNADFVGLQSGDGSLLIQFALKKKLLALNADGTQLVLGKDHSHFISKGSISIAPLGGTPVAHAATIEGMVAVLFNVLSQLGAVQVFPWTPGQVTAAIMAGLPLAALGSIAPFVGALTAAIQAKPDDKTGLKPGVGSSGVFLP